MTRTDRARRLLHGLAAFLAIFVLGWVVVPDLAHSQPAQWNYSVGPDGNAVANYPGNVTVQLNTEIFGNITIHGTCTGCSAVGAAFLGVPQTWTATQTFNGSATTLGLFAPNLGEVVTITGAAPPATVNYDVLTQSVRYANVAAVNNWTLNIRGNGSTTLNAVLATGQAITISHVTTQGASPFFANVIQVDGTVSGVTTVWQGGAPGAGNANGLDVYTFTVIKTASATWTVLATLVQFK